MMFTSDYFGQTHILGACFHPLSCAACQREGWACGQHRAGEAFHRDCTGTTATVRAQ